MKTELSNYEIFPKAVPSGEPVTIYIKPLGEHVAFESGAEYRVLFVPMTQGFGYPDQDKYDSAVVTPERSVLAIRHAFPGEQEHLVRVFRGDDPGSPVVTLSVYSLLPDLYAHRPYRGDFHVHSCRSDGQEAPAVVAANYRKAGFDFLAISDHGQWGPSKEAIRAWAGQPIDLRLFHGEEVHTPGNHIHIVNFGGDASANAAATLDQSMYEREVAEIRSKLPQLPAGVDGFEAAACLWSSRKIQEGGGMSIFAHPHWISDSYHVRDAMTWYLLEHRLCDAFELLGGQTVPENNMQTALYNEARAKGFSIPIVGSSDSHGTVNATWFGHTFTVVLAKGLEREDIIEAVQGGFSAAVESYDNNQLRVYGSYRMVSYVLYLLREYFPLHDELCFEEGRAMKDSICGDESAQEILKLLRGRTERLLNKCFQLSV